MCIISHSLLETCFIINMDKNNGYSGACGACGISLQRMAAGQFSLLPVSSFPLV